MQGSKRIVWLSQEGREQWDSELTSVEDGGLMHPRTSREWPYGGTPGAAVLSTLNALGKPFRESRRRLLTVEVAIKAAQRVRIRESVL
ncbi:hypothetical protein DPMN_181891 [Dreissena polymorpha]|uniref:Uncharacterized protein n=1 Tax=Dreissena polymorpha TaxID=45954 RepID=A0A9D4DDQ0_DREPO|nr:hypothetical protein DPMN_181891 [Dreissena polymorpha]